VLTDIPEKLAVEIWPVQRCLLPDDDARHGQAAMKRRGSSEEARPPLSVLFSAVEEKPSAGLGEESESRESV
jgi:hypothetical protein